MNRALKSMIVLKFASQENFSERIGMNRSFVSNVVQSRRKLSFQQRIKWAEALGCDVTDIFPEPKQDKNPSTDLKSQKGVID